MAWWSQGQGQLGDLNSKSRDELTLILTRQQKILSNKQFIQTLPDKGKKISKFVEKVHHALANLDEEEKMQASLSSVRHEFQSKYKQALAQRRHDALRPALKDDEQSRESAGDVVMSSGEGGGQQSSDTTGQGTEPEELSGGAAAAEVTDLLETLERVTLAEETTSPPKHTKKNSSQSTSSSGTETQKKPHYIEVLKKSDANVAKLKKFKPNQLPVKSASPSPGQSPGSATPLTAEARRQRDRKHLDDVTAAKLPPLHHTPAQLLSLEESVSILQEQTRKHEELQAKLAAQRLAEGLSVRMSRLNPEGGATAAYREVHDEGALLSDED